MFTISGCCLIAPPPSPETPLSKEEKRKDKRNKIFDEIVETEKTYVEMLSVLVELYVVPLSSESDVSPFTLPEDKVQTLFSNIYTLWEFNRTFLVELEKRKEVWNEDQQVGNIFVQFAPFFKMYKLFINNYDNAIQLFHTLMKNPKFQTFCQEREVNPRSKGLRMESFLIMPIQRIPRYKLLLAELLKNTSEEHPDHVALIKALELVETVARDINAAVKESESRQVVWEIQAQFLGDVQLVAPHRVLIQQGKLTKTCRKTNKTYTFFLFSDLFVYAQHMPVVGKYKCKHQLPIDSHFRIEEVPETDETPHAWKIVSPVKSFFVFAETEEEKAEWYEAISQCIEDRKKDIVTSHRRDVTQVSGGTDGLDMAPIYQHDDKCSACFKKFKGRLMYRKHHCRKW